MKLTFFRDVVRLLERSNLIISKAAGTQRALTVPVQAIITCDLALALVCFLDTCSYVSSILWILGLRDQSRVWVTPYWCEFNSVFVCGLVSKLQQGSLDLSLHL